jgi:predicted permease
MKRVRRLFLRLGNLLSRRRGTWAEREFSAEVEAHIALMAEEFERQGMTPEEARRQALIKLGGVEQVREMQHEARTFVFFESLVQDVRFALRMLRKNPGFTIVAVLTLALGIGANTAIFTVVYGTLLRALPFPDPSHVMRLAETFQGRSDGMSLNYAQWERLQEFARPFDALGAYTGQEFNVTAGNGTEHDRAMPVSAGFLRVVGENPEAGRSFLPSEDNGAGETVAIVSHALSVRRFGSVSAAVGQVIFLSGEPYTVIGVMPAHFSADMGVLDGGPPWEVWIPLARVAKTVGNGENIDVLARVRQGATPAEVAAETDLIRRQFHKEFPNDAGETDTMSFLPLAQLASASSQTNLLILFGATGFVLLIACANVSNLLLARGMARTREVAVRLAMGASRARLLRQLLTESVVIALAGGALGFAVAREGVPLLLTLAPSGSELGAIGIPRINDIRVDAAILVFAVGVSFLTGMLFGIFPALYAGKANLNRELREGSAGAGVSRGHARLRQALVAGEFALSLVLLTGAGLMIATCAKLLNTNPGFDPHHVLTMEFWLGGTSHDTTPKVAEYYSEVEQKLAAMPGVEAAGVVGAGLPLERGGNNSIRIPGPDQAKFKFSNYREASPGYFGAMGMPLREGRGILQSDTSDSTPVVVINEAFVRTYFRGQEPVGGHVYVNSVLCEVVGVVADAKSSLDKAASAATFIPAAQASYGTSNVFEGWFPRSIVVRTAGDPLAFARTLRETVASVDPAVATGAILSMDQMMSRSVALRQFMMLLLSLFSGLALVLASVGIYGVISYGVSQRTREIGIRIALGARPGEVLGMILMQGLKLVAAGVVVGVIAAMSLTRLLQGMLYGVSVTDPSVFLLGTATLVIVSLAACFIPARRAMRVDPMVALRHE